MAETMSKPLLTFAIAAFNQESFIREAVEAAFAQTYSNLEIILSDDCSRDRTFDIIKEMAAAYRGPHRVVINRNPRQMSIGGHINRVVELSKGELIVGAAGDDISFPERTQKAFEAWEQCGRKATSIHSRYIQIDEQGTPITQMIEESAPIPEGQGVVEQKLAPVSYIQTLEPIVFGCAHTFSRELFRVFGRLPDNIIHEDNALALRSSIVGQVLYLKEPLVKYRVHGNNIYVRNRARTLDFKVLEKQEEWLKRSLANREVMCEGFLIDLECARRMGLISGEVFEKAHAAAVRKRLRFALQRQFLTGSIFTKFRILGRLWHDGLDQKEKRMLVRRLLPRPVLLRIRQACGYVAVARRKSDPSKLSEAA